MKNTIVIALVGKGGVGKTSISALTVRLLAQKYPDKKGSNFFDACGRQTLRGYFNTLRGDRKAAPQCMRK